MIYNYFSTPGKKETDYATLWKSFIQVQKLTDQWVKEKGIYSPGSFQKVNQAFVERGVNKEIKDSFG